MVTVLKRERGGRGHAVPDAHLGGFIGKNTQSIAVGIGTAGFSWCLHDFEEARGTAANCARNRE